MTFHIASLVVAQELIDASQGIVLFLDLTQRCFEEQIQSELLESLGRIQEYHAIDPVQEMNPWLARTVTYPNSNVFVQLSEGLGR